jgi:hypothetical protein
MEKEAGKIPRMKKAKLGVCMLLCLECTAAYPQWSEIHRFEDGVRIYADRSSLRNQGGIPDLWHLVRWAEPQREDDLPPYLSTRVRTAYDCAEKGERFLESQSFSGAMGDGAEVLTDTREASAWLSISEGSMEEKLWKLACSGR